MDFSVYYLVHICDFGMLRVKGPLNILIEKTNNNEMARSSPVFTDDVDSGECLH